MKVPAHLNNYFDYEKWVLKYDPKPLVKEENRQATTATKLSRNLSQSTEVDSQINFTNQIGIERGIIVLVKSRSTMHIPAQMKQKTQKRVFGVFDRNIANKMFGYRVNFQMEQMKEGCPHPSACQAHKPIHKFTNEIIAELNKNYEVIPKYFTYQKILVPYEKEN